MSPSTVRQAQCDLPNNEKKAQAGDVSSSISGFDFLVSFTVSGKFNKYQYL